MTPPHKATSRLCARELGTERFHREYRIPGRPVVVTEAADEWRAMSTWSPDYFKAAFGSKIVTIKSNDQGVFDRNKGAVTGPVHIRSTSFAQAVDLIRTEHGPKHYIQQQSIFNEFPELLPDLAPPYLLDRGQQILAANFWFGSRGCKTPLHYDYSDNFLIQVFGAKTITLFSPHYTPYLYAASSDINPHTSRVNVFAPDLAKFPLYAKAYPDRLECEITSGAMLYIPKGWWHAVESTEIAASVNVWWSEAQP